MTGLHQARPGSRDYNLNAALFICFRPPGGQGGASDAAYHNKSKTESEGLLL